MTATDPGTILIVDDERNTRALLETRVRREGYRTLTAEHGRQALDTLRAGSVDLVILDINMPEMDGFQVLSAMTADPLLAHIPVIVISGGGDQDDVARCIEMGAVDYLAKPFNQAVLRARLTTSVERKRRREEELRLLQAAGVPTAAPVPAPSAPATASAPAAAAAPEDPSSMVGRRLGSYVLRRIIGRGGMGVVFEADHTALDRKVAVKVLPSRFSRDHNMLERFRLEAKTSARLDHPNVVGVYDVAEADGNWYIAMQLVAGVNAQTLLDAKGALSEAQATHIVREACRGLWAAHYAGVIHRDVKPSNIMIAADGAVKLVDFGLAKTQIRGGSSSGLSTPDMIIGTVEYISPEACNGEPVDQRSDIYSLGATFFALLTGRPPFRGNDVAVAYGHCFLPPPDPRESVPAVSDRSAEIAMRAMAKKPADRFATAADMLAALETPPV